MELSIQTTKYVRILTPIEQVLKVHYLILSFNSRVWVRNLIKRTLFGRLYEGGKYINEYRILTYCFNRGNLNFFSRNDYKFDRKHETGPGNINNFAINVNACKRL